MSEFRTVGRHTLVYGLGIVASKLFSFLMLPVYTRYLTPADYGVIELLSLTIDVIGMVAGVALVGGLFKFYAEAPTPSEKRRVMSTVAVGQIGISALVLAVGILASPWLTRLVLGSEHPATYFRLFFGSWALNGFAGVALAYIRVEERSRLFVAVSLAKLVLSVSLAIFFVVHLRLGVTGVLLGTLVTAAISFIGLAAYLFTRIGLHFALSTFVRLWRFGAPIAVWTIGSFILMYSDRLFLQRYHGEGAVGLYGLAYKFAFLLSTLVEPFSQIWEPRRFVIAQQPDAGEIYRRMFLYFNLVLFAGAIGLMLLIRDGLTLLVGAEFVEAYRLVPLLLATTVIQHWTSYCNIGLFVGTDGSTRFAAAALPAVVVALMGNALLIPTLGGYGAVLATMLAFVVRFMLVYLWSQSRYPIRYPWRDVGVLCLLFACIWAARRALDTLPFWPSLAGSAVLAGVAGLVMYGRLDEQARVLLGRHIRRPWAMLSQPAA